MIDLSRDIIAAKQYLDGWKWMYDRKEYPHEIARNMMRVSYTVSLLWKDFESGQLPSLDKQMAIFQIEYLYDGKVSSIVDPSLDTWLDANRSIKVGGISYVHYDGLATVAETDDSILEEIEFSYVFHYLVDRCVLYTIGLCLAGNDIKTALGIISEKTLVDTNDISYDTMKQFFQEVCVKQYMRNHMPNGRQDNSYIFQGDKFSEPTSCLTEYIYKTPQLYNYMKSYTGWHDFNALLDAYEMYLFAQNKLSHIIQNRIKNIKNAYINLLKNIDKLKNIDISKQLKDDFDIAEYKRRTLSGEEIVQYFSTCTHPYVCSKIAINQLDYKQRHTEGLVYLQKALNCAFSFPNVFWNNTLAMCGCADAVVLLERILPYHTIKEFEQMYDVSLFMVEYLLLRRAIHILDDSHDAQRYRTIFANVIGEHEDELIKEGLQKEIINIYASYFLGDKLYSEEEYYTAKILFSQFESNVYNLYSIGNLRIGEDLISDLIQFIKNSEQNLSIVVFLASRRFHEIKHDEIPMSSSWSRRFTKAEQRLIDIAQLKDKTSEFENFLDEHGIKYLYHFTDRANLESIRKEGLYSYRYLMQNKITTYPGGDEEMQKKDKEYDLDDHIRLSFCERHPMGWRLKTQENRDFVILKIDRRVVFSKTTLFSDINATNPNHHHGGELTNLKAVNMDAVNAQYSTLDSIQHEQKTAEVMVKKNIPLEYILNIDNPESF